MKKHSQRGALPAIRHPYCGRSVERLAPRPERQRPIAGQGRRGSGPSGRRHRPAAIEAGFRSPPLGGLNEPPFKRATTIDTAHRSVADPSGYGLKW
jgi:hypothetical protein